MQRGLKPIHTSFAVLFGATLLFFSHAMLVQAASGSPGPAITIQGKTFYKDGKPWILKGVHVGAFNRPKFIPSAPKWRNDSSAQVRNLWGPDELNAVKRVFGADTIRMDVSQPALDPQSSIYDPNYLSDVLSGIKLARSMGFFVIVVVNAQAPSGLDHLSGMPDDGTIRAWKTLGPALMQDQGILMELFNEPSDYANSQVKQAWAQSMQALIDTIRGLGAKNILLLDGLWYARQTNDLFPMVRDTILNRMALAVHPYFIKGSFETEKQWRDQFGASAERYPLIASEWNAVPAGGGCIGQNLPSLALSLMRYLEKLHVGLVGWGIDSNSGRLVKDHTGFEPTDYSTFTDCTKTPTDSGGGKLLANYPND